MSLQFSQRQFKVLELKSKDPSGLLPIKELKLICTDKTNHQLLQTRLQLKMNLIQIVYKLQHKIIQWRLTMDIIIIITEMVDIRTHIQKKLLMRMETISIQKRLLNLYILISKMDK